MSTLQCGIVHVFSEKMLQWHIFAEYKICKIIIPRNTYNSYWNFVDFGRWCVGRMHRTDCIVIVFTVMPQPMYVNMNDLATMAVQKQKEVMMKMGMAPHNGKESL